MNHPDGRHSLARWYFLEGYREMGLPPEPSIDEARYANLPCADLPQFFAIPVTWLMRELWARKQAQLRASRARHLPNWLEKAANRLSRRWQSLKTRGGQSRLLSWHFLEGLTEARLTSLITDEQADYLRAIDPQHQAERILVLAWKQCRKLDRHFASPRDSRFLDWIAKEGAKTWPILAHPKISLAKTPAPATPLKMEHPFGVNLIGHARGRSGISEDVRMAALALRSAGIPHAICDLGTAENFATEDDSVEHLIQDDLPFAINLFCVTAVDTVAAISRGPRDFRKGRYTIGFWPWELSKWPALWAHAYDFVDEVWASSEFTFNAHREVITKPLRHLPMAVSTKENAGLSRADFGIPEDKFVFSFSFDGLSSFARKNPDGCLVAFQRAFPQGDEPVALVLKGLRVEEFADWQKLRSAAEADPRIVLLGQSLTRGALLDLYRLTDCFVSLHRSEGFGRNIAECMSLGKPVIVTGYSGNMDFTVPDGAALVPASLRDVAVCEYPFGDGQHWADPDVDAAAELMRRMVADRSWRAAIAAAGKIKVDNLYSAPVVGAAYSGALESIYNSMDVCDQ